MIRAAMIAVGLALLAYALYFAHGSLEMFPTEEQQQKVRLVTGMTGVFLASLEVALWLLLRLVARRGSRPSPPE